MSNPSTLQYLSRKKLVIKDLEHILNSKKKQDYGNSDKRTPINLLQSIENSNREIDEMEEHIEMLLVAANSDRNILEECENYIQQKYNLHLTEASSPKSTSEYEYCLELIKNAKIRASLETVISPSLDRITVNPNKMNGQPCIRDLRLTVGRVLELLQTYPDRSELFREFPDLTKEDIRQAILYNEIRSKDASKNLTAATSISHETFA
jgi:uncharacterized protein (DUF433 family)